MGWPTLDKAAMHNNKNHNAERSPTTKVIRKRSERKSITRVSSIAVWSQPSQAVITLIFRTSASSAVKGRAISVISPRRRSITRSFPSFSPSFRLSSMADPEHPPEATAHDQHVEKGPIAAGKAGTQQQLLAALTATDATIRRLDL